MFLSLSHTEKTDRLFVLAPDTALALPPLGEGTAAYLKEALLRSSAASGEGCPIRSVELREDPSLDEEEFWIKVGGDTVILGRDKGALLQGFSALMALSEEGELFGGTLRDKPAYPIRGYRGFLPGKKDSERQAFLDMVDLLAYYRYNTLFLEVGGAMEYKRHPEIGEKWLEFCRETHRYSGRTKEIQFETYPWDKNSIHTDNGEGDVLTQNEVRALIAYCRDRGIDVIPEVPTLSHTDYLVMAHPEMAERENDAYPDTYCPYAPGVYELVFDVIDEILEVFECKQMHIGHDEAYSVGVCPRCRNRVPSDIYAEDIAKIRDYLAGKGVGCLMWAEKLLPAVYNGSPIGGNERWKTLPDGTEICLSPKLYDAAEKLPRDIVMFHWYWQFDPAYDEVYEKNGYRYLFGNASLASLEECDRRLPRTLGAVASNWGSYLPEYMQRNLQTFDLTFNARAMLSKDFDATDAGRAREVERTMAECYRYDKRGKRDLIELSHTTTVTLPFRYYYDGIFIDDERDTLGEYVATYEDGETATLPVKFGYNISFASLENRAITMVSDTMLEGNSALCHSSHYKEVSVTTLPRVEGGRVVYLTAYQNPRPGKRVSSLAYRPLKEGAAVELLSWKQP